jgi:Mrp family chromosome partitioning ATPase/LPS O-antigen subunit length determinant protein (WzzB/FepE family)
MTAAPERWAEGPTITASIWRYRWLVLAVTLLFGAAGYVGSASQDEVYEASTLLYLSDPTNTGVFGQQPGSVSLERYVPQQTDRVTSTPVLTLAAELLEDGTSPRALADGIEASGDTELGTLEITASDGDPDRAAAVANTVAAAYERSVREAQAERVDRAVTELDRSIEAIEEQVTELATQGDEATGQISVLTQRLVELDSLGQQLLVDSRLFGSGVEFIEEAQAPSSPVEPRPRRTAAMSAILGMLLASAVAYWLAGRAQKITSRHEPAEVLGVPLLGVLPTYTPLEVGTLAQRTALEPRTAEAYRFVFSSLRAMLQEAGATSVMITSAMPGVGKTESALQLAATARRRDQKVLLMDADLRIRGLSAFLHADRSEGLLDLADPLRDVPPDSFVVPYPLDRGRALDIITAGRPSGPDRNHLNESWFGPAYERVTQGYELVVVDTPPLLAVADTATIAGYTDAIVLVVREGSNLDELERVRQRLRFVGERLVGYVYLSPTALDDTDFDYGLVRSRAWREVDLRFPPVQGPTDPAGGSGPPSGRPSGGAATHAGSEPRNGSEPTIVRRIPDPPPQVKRHGQGS